MRTPTYKVSYSAFLFSFTFHLVLRELSKDGNKKNLTFDCFSKGVFHSGALNILPPYVVIWNEETSNNLIRKEMHCYESEKHYSLEQREAISCALA